jgi:class 3 adenylate cyclase
MPKLPRPNIPRYGQLIRNAREARGLSIEQVAHAAGMAPHMLLAIEEGTQPSPPNDIAKRLYNALQLNGDDRDWLSVAAMAASPIAGTFLSPVLSTLMRPKVDDTEKQPQPLTASILAFLIADVRGYTHFVKAQGDAAAARLATRFATLAKQAMTRWDGRLVEIRGDEVLGVFGSARQALHAALDMQDRFAEASAADPEMPLAVGIGLDVGEAVPVEDGYRGIALNRAARLCALAGGGEILVTAGLMYVAPIVDGVAFVSHGKVPLKGFDEPADVLAIARTTLAQELPPGPPRGALPPPS